MNYNVVTYSLYLSITLMVIILLGNVFYKNGRIFILSIYNHQEQLTDSINRLLLAGYYLVNIGYAFLTIKGWEKVESTQQMMESLSTQIGGILLILAILHFLNVFALLYLSKKYRKEHRLNLPQSNNL